MKSLIPLLYALLSLSFTSNVLVSGQIDVHAAAGEVLEKVEGVLDNILGAVGIVKEQNVTDAVVDAVGGGEDATERSSAAAPIILELSSQSDPKHTALFQPPGTTHHTLRARSDLSESEIQEKMTNFRMRDAIRHEKEENFFEREGAGEEEVRHLGEDGSVAYAGVKRGDKKLARRWRTGVAMENFFDSLYYTTISIGTPAQTFTVLIDTGSADLYVPALACGTACGNRRKYDASKSSTAVLTGSSTSVYYGTGSASGSVVVDTMRFGNLTISNQVFIQATSITGSHPANVDGLLGLSFSGMSWANYVAPKLYKGKSSPIENLHKQNLINDTTFALSLPRYNYSTKTQIKGEIAIGATVGNPAKYMAPVRWLNVSGTNNWWIVSLSNVSVSNWNYNKGVVSSGPYGNRTVKAVVDSGTALIVTDYATASVVNKALGAYATGIQGIWGVDCKTLRSKSVTVTITLWGTPFTLSGKDLPVQVYADDPNLCYAPFMVAYGGDNTDRFILGEVFLRKFYSIYDYNYQPTGKALPRVGLALQR